MENISLQGTDLNINGYKICLLDIDFIIFDNGINVYHSSGRVLNFKIDLNHFINMGTMFVDFGIEQFVYLKGHRIVNVENINKVLYSDNGIQVITNKHKVKMNSLNENHAKMLAEMYYTTTFISDYGLVKDDLLK